MKKISQKGLSIKGAVLDKDKLCDYLEKLASEHTIKPYSNIKTFPLEALKEDYKIIWDTYQLLNEHAKLKMNIDPAGEWILDNFYVVEEITKQIQKELSLKKYRNLAGLGNGKYIGFARIYVLAAEIISYTDGKIEEEALKQFLNAYQSKKALTMDEIWSFPIFLQLVCVQNIRQICEKIYNSQVQKYRAEGIIERIIENKSKRSQNFDKRVNYLRHENEGMNYTFIQYLSYKLKSYGKKGIPYLQILEEQVKRTGTTVGDVIKHVHFSLAVNKVSMRKSDN